MSAIQARRSLPIDPHTLFQDASSFFIYLVTIFLILLTVFVAAFVAASSKKRVVITYVLAESLDNRRQRFVAMVLSVLQTVIPYSVIFLAAINPDVLMSDLALSMSASHTPDCFKALLSDVKFILPQLIEPVLVAAVSSISVASDDALLNGNFISVTSIKPVSLTSTSFKDIATASSTFIGGATYLTDAVNNDVASAVDVLSMLVL